MSTRARTSIIALILFAAYSLFVVVAGIVGHGHGSVFWVEIGVVILLGVAALAVARWIYRRRES